jgi:hypothetical protein
VGRPSEHGLDARGQLARGKRLGDIVVSADLETGDAVGLFIASGQHDHRDRTRDPPANLKAVDPGQSDVEHDQAHGVATELGQSVLAGANPDHGVALARQVRADEIPDIGLVLDHHQVAPTPMQNIVGGPRRPGTPFLHAADLRLTGSCRRGHILVEGCTTNRQGD